MTHCFTVLFLHTKEQSLDCDPFGRPASNFYKPHKRTRGLDRGSLRQLMAPSTRRQGTGEHSVLLPASSHTGRSLPCKGDRTWLGDAENQARPVSSGDMVGRAEGYLSDRRHSRV